MDPFKNTFQELIVFFVKIGCNPYRHSVNRYNIQKKTSPITYKWQDKKKKVNGFLLLIQKPSLLGVDLSCCYIRNRFKLNQMSWLII